MEDHQDGSPWIRLTSRLLAGVWQPLLARDARRHGSLLCSLPSTLMSSRPLAKPSTRAVRTNFREVRVHFAFIFVFSALLGLSSMREFKRGLAAVYTVQGGRAESSGCAGCWKSSRSMLARSDDPGLHVSPDLACWQLPAETGRI